MDQDDGGNRCGHSLLRPRAGFARPAHRPVPALLQQEKEVVCVRVRDCTSHCVWACVCLCVHACVMFACMGECACVMCMHACVCVIFLVYQAWAHVSLEKIKVMEEPRL